MSFLITGEVTDLNTFCGGREVSYVPLQALWGYPQVPSSALYGDEKRSEI